MVLCNISHLNTFEILIHTHLKQGAVCAPTKGRLKPLFFGILRATHLPERKKEYKEWLQLEA